MIASRYTSRLYAATCVSVAALGKIHGTVTFDSERHTPGPLTSHSPSCTRQPIPPTCCRRAPRWTRGFDAVGQASAVADACRLRSVQVHGGGTVYEIVGRLEPQTIAELHRQAASPGE